MEWSRTSDSPSKPSWAATAPDKVTADIPRHETTRHIRVPLPDGDEGRGVTFAFVPILIAIKDVRDLEGGGWMQSSVSGGTPTLLWEKRRGCETSAGSTLASLQSFMCTLESRKGLNFMTRLWLDWNDSGANTRTHMRGRDWTECRELLLPIAVHAVLFQVSQMRYYLFVSACRLPWHIFYVSWLTVVQHPWKISAMLCRDWQLFLLSLKSWLPLSSRFGFPVYSSFFIKRRIPSSFKNRFLSDAAIYINVFRLCWV